MEARRILQIICLLVYSFVFAQSCPFTVDNGNRMNLVGTLVTNQQQFSWIVVINDRRVTVATCHLNGSKCDDQYPGFEADVSLHETSNGRYNFTTTLSIDKVNISMSHVALKDLDGCEIQVYVLPTKPVCDDPIFVNSHISVTCRTERVYPKAVCKFYHTGPGGALPGRISYDHSRRQSDSLYTSECTFLADVEKVQNGKAYEFYVEVYPDVEDGSDFSKTSNKTNSIVYNRAAITNFTVNDQETHSLVIEKMASVSFDCQAGGHPEATMKLLKGDNRAIVTTSNDPNKLLYATPLDCDDMDTYTCEADNGISDESSIKVYVTCPLRLTHESDRNEYTISGDEETKTITFRVTGYPEPSNYTLKIKDEASMTTVPDYEYRTNSHYEPATQISVQEVTLTLLNNSFIRDAQYVLIVNNGLGELHIPFKLTMEESSDDFPVLPVALGVAGGVLLLIVIGVIAFVCHRRRSRKAQREATTGVDNPGHNA